MKDLHLDSFDNGKAAGNTGNGCFSFYKAAFDSAQDEIFLKDLDLRYVYANPAFLRTWESDLSSFIGKTNAEIFGSHDPAVDDLDRRVLEGEIIENDVLWPHGKEKRFVHTVRTPLRNEAGEIIGIFVIARDVTEHREAQAALRESEERFRAVVESTSDCIWIKNKFLEFTHVNPAFLKLWGAASPTAFIGKTREEAFGEKNDHVDALERRVLNGEIVEEDVSFPTDFWDFHFHDTRLPLRNDKDEIIGMCGIRRDLTDHVRAEETNRRASRFEAAMASSRGIAHDFSNMMTIILGNIGLLRMQLAELPNSDSQLDSVYRTAQRAKDMAQQMLTLAQGGDIANFKLINIQTIMDEMISLYAHTIPQELILEMDLNADLWDISGNASQLSRVLMNLGINSVEAMKNKGILHVMTDNVTIDRVVAEKYPGLIVDRRYVHLSFEDTGCGMDQETMDKLFDPYYSTKAEGRGLGLSVVYSTIKNHNGHIFCRSQPNRGTTFDIFFPALIIEDSRAAEQDASLPRGSETILVIDDEELILATAKKLLGCLGYNVLSASSGSDALKMISEAAVPSVDMVVIDMDVAGTKEAGIVQQFRELRPEMKIVFCSDYTLDFLSRPLPRNAINGFIHKPFRLGALAPAIRKVLDNEISRPTKYVR